MAYKITLENIFGELDSRLVHDREQIQGAVLDMVGDAPYLSPGDKIQVIEVDPATGRPARRR
jgi:hypothetical protein